MNLGELLKEARFQLRDNSGAKQDAFWSDSELVRYANAARDRMYLIVRKLTVDSTTALDNDDLPLCTVNLLADTATYALSPKILGITRLKLASQAMPLEPSTVEELDRNYDWESMASGDPLTYCIDMANDSITFVPAPKVNDTAKLTVTRMPLDRLSTDTPDASLGFREEYHEDLIPWMLHLAFSKQDAETYNPNLAESYKKTFLDRAAEIKLEMHRHLSKPKTNRVQRAYGAR